MTLVSTPSEHGHAPLPNSFYAPAAGGVAAMLAETGEAPGLDFVLRFLPVCDLARQTIGALFCTPVSEIIGPVLYGHGAFPRPAPEWAALDCAILEHAAAFEDQLVSEGLAVAVGASVSYATLSDPRGRLQYREALRAAHAGEHAQLVIKIEDIPDHVGAHALGEVVQSLKPLAPRIWVHLAGSHVPVGGQDLFHAMGLVLSMPPKLPLSRMTAEARWLDRVAKQQAALACMDHVDTMTELEVAHTAGVRFVEGLALGRTAVAARAPLNTIRDALESPLASPPAAR
jgi:hypothetical protein